jgi:hypothetical protein
MEFVTIDTAAAAEQVLAARRVSGGGLRRNGTGDLGQNQDSQKS